MEKRVQTVLLAIDMLSGYILVKQIRARINALTGRQ